MGATRSGRRGRSSADSGRVRLLPAFLLALLVASGCTDAGVPESALPGAVYDPPRPAPALRLAGTGGAYDLAAEPGRVSLVFFGFTNCPDICPTTLERWVEVRRLLGREADAVRFVFVSIDAKRDTPDIAARYAAGFDSSFVGLSGTDAEIRETALAWGIAAERRTAANGDAGDADILHASQVFVIDQDGLLRRAYGRSATAHQIVAAIRALRAGHS